MAILDNVLVYDVETTIYKHQNLVLQEGVVNTKNKEGSAFCLPQKLVMSGFKWLNDDDDEPICIDHLSKVRFSKGLRERYDGIPQRSFDDSTLIVGFHLKFDLHWARRIGIDISKVVVWDCQLAEFILDSQRNKYPSMNQACEKYGLPRKLDVVKEEYWDKGIDTDMVPKDILREYLYGDLERTEDIFLEQFWQFKGIRL